MSESKERSIKMPIEYWHFLEKLASDNDSNVSREIRQIIKREMERKIKSPFDKLMEI